jgi:putative membrane protein
MIEFLKGLIIGAAMIIPGVSGGVLAVILGIYDKLLKAVSHLFKDFKKNMLYLIPIGSGIVLGILIVSKLLQYLFEKYTNPIQFTFMGFIIGSIPVLFRHIKNKKGKFNYVACIITFLFAIVLVILDKNNAFGIVQTNNIVDVSTIRLFISGIFLAIGTIVPGISNFQLLMLIGTYTSVLNAIAAFTNPFAIGTTLLMKLIPLILGFVIGAIILVKLLSHLIEKYYTVSYSAISGFVIGSIPIIYPGFSWNLEGFICILLLIGGFLLSNKISSFEKE